MYDYAALDAAPHVTVVGNINPYLADGPNVVVTKRSAPLDGRPKMRCGSKPTDGGFLILSAEERTELLASFPTAADWVRPYIGSEEFINGSQRWCLWLKGVAPAAIRAVKPVMERVEAVRKFREASTAAPTRATASTPGQFFFVSQPATDYILVPEVSSERRRYVPVGWMSPNIISSNKNYIVSEPSLWIFGMLQSVMHMAWLATVGGRLKSDFQYSASLVYNNFPWPDPPGSPTTVRTERSRPQDGEVEVSPPGPSTSAADAAYAQGERGGLDVQDARSEKHRAPIETAAQAVLDVRAAFPDSTLADLYDPLSMPPALVKAHQNLDRAVDVAYIAAEKAAGRKTPKLTTDAERVAFLFERYQQLTSLLPAAKTKPVRRKRITPKSATAKDGDTTC